MILLTDGIRIVVFFNLLSCLFSFIYLFIYLFQIFGQEDLLPPPFFYLCHLRAYATFLIWAEVTFKLFYLLFIFLFRFLDCRTCCLFHFSSDAICGLTQLFHFELKWRSKSFIYFLCFLFRFLDSWPRGDFLLFSLDRRW